LAAHNNKNNGINLSLANRDFVDKKFPLNKAYVELIEKSYNSKITEVPFSSNASEARQSINTWVQEKTQEKIKNLLTDKDVNAATKMILVNAIYFKGRWLSKFYKSNTSPGNFQCLESKTPQRVQMMQREAKMKYANVKNIDSQIVWLPFSNEKTQVVIILPNKHDGLFSLESKLSLDPNALFEILHQSKTKFTNVDLKLPRLKLETRVSLKDIFSNGEMFDMRDTFQSGRADFSPLTAASADLFLSDVIHKTVFEMDEDGTTDAGGASGVSQNVTTSITKNVIVDHPFLLLLITEPTTPLFMGRITCLEQ
jgi:serpin B